MSLEGDSSSDSDTPTQIEFTASVRAWLDSQGPALGNSESGPSWSVGRPSGGSPGSTAWDNEISIRNLSGSVSRGKWRLAAGFQEIPWGETFGFPILDIVNPRDYRDPLLLDPSWVRLPVAAAQVQVFLDRLTLQGVLTPLPRNNEFVSQGSIYDPIRNNAGISLSNTPNPTSGFVPEFGGKASYLFESGFDWGLIYYHHFNRNPVYSLQWVGANDPPVGSPYQLVPELNQVDTLGTTLSYSLGQFVLRLDSALHLGQPIQGQTLGTIAQGTQWQNVVGTDLTLAEDWTFGVQFQTEYDRFAANTRSLNWISARLSKPVLNGRLTFDLYSFAGVDNSDLWIEPQIKVNLVDPLTILLRADFVYSSGLPNDGYLWIGRDLSRILLWLTWKV